MLSLIHLQSEKRRIYLFIGSTFSIDKHLKILVIRVIRYPLSAVASTWIFTGIFFKPVSRNAVSVLSASFSLPPRAAKMQAGYMEIVVYRTAPASEYSGRAVRPETSVSGNSDNPEKAIFFFRNLIDHLSVRLVRNLPVILWRNIRRIGIVVQKALR